MSRSAPASIPDVRSGRTSRLLLASLLLLAVVRLGSLGLYPLMDMTEARYADIARRMAQSGDWVTLSLDDMRTFWGKPALSFWATAASLQLFGVNAWAARLPHYLMGVAVAAIAWQHAAVRSRRLAWHAVALLAGSGRLRTMPDRRRDRSCCNARTLTVARSKWCDELMTNHQRTSSPT
ncbi:MAG: putative rane protein [Mycobacterium sp.]|nr:putative rane protein [Mycobacterium sp.]